MSDFHPVWEVYDLLRTAKLNEIYFSRRLYTYALLNNSMEFAIAATASTSAIASLTVWKNDSGAILWHGLLIIAAVISVLKPILKITNKVRLYEEVLSGYRSMSYELLQLKSSISTEQQYNAKHKSLLQSIMKKHGTLVTKSPESKENKKVKRECEQEVLNKYPEDSFYIPKGNKNV